MREVIQRGGVLVVEDSGVIEMAPSRIAAMSVSGSMPSLSCCGRLKPGLGA